MSLPYFNSIKVQLELSIVLKPDGLFLFQFHKGTIRTSQKSLQTESGNISIP